MIDPLLSTALPLPIRAHPNEASPDTPSFLAWALGVPTQGEQSDPQLPQPDVIVDPVAQETCIDIGATDLATAVATLDAGQWREQVPVLIELDVRNPQGERELVAMPWRLMASGRLAQSLGAGGYAGSATLLPVAYPASAIAPAQMAGAQSVAAIRHAVGADLSGDPLETASMSPTAVARAIAADDDAPLPSLPLSSPSPAAAEWLARWIKWIERDGRDPVVLLRDFRIDDDEAGRLVDGLRAFAQEHGIELDRIVVNGREFWRRPSFQPSRE